MFWLKRRLGGESCIRERAVQTSLVNRGSSGWAKELSVGGDAGYSRHTEEREAETGLCVSSGFDKSSVLNLRSTKERMTKRLAADTCLAKRPRLVTRCFDPGPPLLVCRPKWQLRLATAGAYVSIGRNALAPPLCPLPHLLWLSSSWLLSQLPLHFLTALPLPSFAQILPSLPCFFCPSILSHIMFREGRGLDRAPLCCGRHANGHLRWNNQKGKDPLSHFTWPRNFTYVICAHTRWRACPQSCD